MTSLYYALMGWILATGLPWYQPGHEPETPDQRFARVGIIAQALELEAKAAVVKPWTVRDLAFAAAAKTKFESRRFAFEVHDGTKRGDGGESVCLGQIRKGGEDLIGTDLASTRRCYREVMRHLIYHQKRCKVRRIDVYTIAVIYSGYGTGHSCDPWAKWDGAGPMVRARAWARMVRR